jgi:hypothetical protein
VTAASIPEKIAIGIEVDQGVCARDFRAGDAQVAFRAAPDRERKVVDRNSAGWQVDLR